MILWVVSSLFVVLSSTFLVWFFGQRALQALTLQEHSLRQSLVQSESQVGELKAELSELHEKNRELESRTQNSLTQLAALQERLEQQAHWREGCQELSQNLQIQQAENAAQQAQLRELKVRLEEEQKSSEQQKKFLLDSEQRLMLQFETLANRIFEQSGRKVDEHSRTGLEKLLLPLREQLDAFRRQVQEGFGQEARERHTLVHEIQHLQQLNVRMARDAVNLTQALKGSSKTQGTWGEVILDRVLQAAGLREGHEYHSQSSQVVGATRRLQPDIIVHLPHGRDVVIDAKVSLTAYERYFNSDKDGGDEAEREQALKEHLASVRNHIKTLGDKEYHKVLAGTNLDYVLLFVPIEPAFLLALDRAPEILNESMEQNIILSSPTTLFLALRTIANLWRYERQSQSSAQIAENAAQIYDKIRLFIEEMERLGTSLARAQESYHKAFDRLTKGRGNLIRQTERFRQMGVAVKKPLSEALVEQAVDIDDAVKTDNSIDEEKLPITIDLSGTEVDLSDIGMDGA